MRGERDSWMGGGTGGGRTDPLSTSGGGAHGLPEIRTGRVLSAERVRVADDYSAALDDLQHPNTCVAAALDVSESVVRRAGHLFVHSRIAEVLHVFGRLQ